MVTTRSQDRKIASSSSPLSAVQTGTALSPTAGRSPARKPKTPSTETPFRTSLAPSSNRKIEVVIDVAPKHGAAAPRPLQERSQSEGEEMGQIISLSQSGNVEPALEESLQNVAGQTSSNDDAKTVQGDDGGALDGMTRDGRKVQATLADRSKRPVSPNYIPAPVPKRKRFSSEDLEEPVPGAENPTNQLAHVVTPTAADEDGVADSDDDAPPEVISSAVAAQQVLGIPSSSLRHTNRKRRKILRNRDDKDVSPVPQPELAITPKPQNPDTAPDEAEEPTVSGQRPQQVGLESETGQAPTPITNEPGAIMPILQETIEITTAPKTNEVPTPPNTTTQSARNETRLQTPENFDATARLQPSEPLADQDIPTSNGNTRQLDSEEQDQHAVSLSTPLSVNTSPADRGPPFTNSDVPYPPPQGTAETEVTAQSARVIHSPGGPARGTSEVRADTAGMFVDDLDTKNSVVSSTRKQTVTGNSVKVPKLSAPTSRARPHPRPSLLGREILSGPKRTSLQQYRTRLLNRHPRTTNWGPPGFRKPKFVGV